MSASSIDRAKHPVVEAFAGLSVIEIYAFMKWACENHPDEILKLAQLYAARNDCND